MTIEILDWVMYLVGLVILWRCLPQDMKEELGAVAGFLVCVIYTIAHTITFYFFSWHSIFQSILNIDVKVTL